MINSEFIKNNFRLPQHLRFHTAFYKYDKFEKVFPLIGLQNSYQTISDLKFSFKGCLKQSSIIPFLPYDKITPTSVSEQCVILPISFLMNLAYILVRKRLRDKRNYKIYFSSDEEGGAWDVFTMSMRGIKSCLSWEATNSKHLVGSIIDPCCGIIYLTDGSPTDIGSKMLFRCVVRYVIHSRIGPCLFLERPYSMSGVDIREPDVVALFTNFLFSKTNLPIISDELISEVYREQNPKQHLFIPKHPLIEEFIDNVSYRDSRLPYKFITNDHLKKFKSLAKIKHLFFRG